MKKTFRRFTALALGAGLALTVLTTGATAANAEQWLAPAAASAPVADDGVVSPQAIYYTYAVINKTKYSNALGTQIFASCTIGTSGGTCTISKGKTVTRSIQVALGYTRSGVAGNLSISSAQSVAITTSCSSPALPAGSSWKARSYGDRHTYQIRRTTLDSEVPQPLATETSALREAFNPYDNRIYCY